MKWFSIIAWIILVIGSVLLSFIDFYDFSSAFNNTLTTLTSNLLGLSSLN
jgi:cell shape-determining protein MreC